MKCENRNELLHFSSVGRRAVGRVAEHRTLPSVHVVTSIAALPTALAVPQSSHEFFEKPPSWKYKNEVPPRLGVIIDDCLGTPLLSKPSAGLVNLCIKHRHVGKGLGISIFMLVQSYCAQGGINRAIRKNCTMLLLFKLNQDAQIRDIFANA